MKHNPALDGLRGFAALLVLVAHLANEGLALIPLTHDHIGKAGVWVFFSLSAYLLTKRLSEQPLGPRPVWRYAMNRVFRIFPLLISFFVLHAAMGNIPWDMLPAHLLLTTASFQEWAVSTEFQYYLLIPVIAIAAARAPNVRLVIGASCVLAFAYSMTAPDRVFDTTLWIAPKLVPFLLGSLLAVTPLRAAPPAAAYASGALLIAGAWGYRAIHLGSLDVYFAPFVSAALGLAACGLIHAMIRDGALTRFFGSAPMAWLGKVSFSIYLLHYFLIEPAKGFGLSGWYVATATLLISYASYYAIEAPGIRMGRKIGGLVFLQNLRYSR